MKLFKYILLSFLLLISSAGYSQNNLLSSGTNLIKIGNNLITPVEYNRYSVLLDGVDEVINIDAVRTALAITTKGTITFWAKVVDADAGNQILYGFGDTDANTYSRLYIGTTGLLLADVVLSGTIQWSIDTDNIVFLDNVWSHVSIVQPNDGNGVILYFNGVKPDQAFCTNTSLNSWFNNLSGLDNGRLGCDNINSGGNARHYNGNIDEITFWNRDLSAAEILVNFNVGVQKFPNRAGLVSYFKIDGDVVNTATDKAGSNNGTYVNVEQADIELDTP